MKKSFSALCLTLAVLLGITAVLYGEYTRPVTENAQNGCPEGSIEDMRNGKCVAPSPQENEQKLASWEKSQELFSEGYIAESDFFLTRFFTEEIHDFSALIDLFGELDKREYKPLHFISGEYSEEFLDNFFIGSWFQWRRNIVDEDRLSVLTESAMDKDEELYVEVWGQPRLSKWSLIAKDDVYNAYAVGFGNTSISHGKFTEDEQGIPCEDIEVTGPVVKVFAPVFEDINDDGNPELLLRYNLAVGDGYIQYLQIYQSSFHEDTCSTYLVRDFSARNGFVLYSNKVFTVGTQTALDSEPWLSASQHIMEEISYDGETENTLSRKTVKNVLRGDDSRFWK